MSREAFEVWLARDSTLPAKRDGDSYADFTVSVMWHTWKAARAAALDEAAEIADSHATCEGIGQCIAAEIRALKEKE